MTADLPPGLAPGSLKLGRGDTVIVPGRWYFLAEHKLLILRAILPATLSRTHVPSTYMLLGPFRRSRRQRRSWLRLAILFLIVVLSVDFLVMVTSNPPVTRVSPSSMHSTSTNRERVFIASMHWNNEFILRTHWNNAVIGLVEYFGADNVYISITEGGSWDNTRGALQDLDAELEKLGVERSIEFTTKSHKDEIERIPEPEEEGWIWTSRNKKELRRIPYLAEIRNKVMEKLYDLAERKSGRGQRHFDKVLWLNDVIFTVSCDPCL